MAPSKQTKPAAVVWDRRGMKNLHLIPGNIDAFVRAQIAEQVAQSPGTVYVPVSWEDTQAIHHAPGPSSTGLMDAPFIGGITFIRIAHRPNTPATNAPQAGVVLKDPKNVIGLTPGHTVTPCSMFFPAAILPPDSLERSVGPDFMADPTCHIGMINEGVQIEYLISYWKKTQFKA
ncbi:hypothetical protein C8F04DRAFT_1121137 [Mycena alexandri]|uniref:Uncharacterized protein n=1 Tax=Mycena alexandri TaxID=1745969 RepID=A0AAD6SKS1_9AGAR|nr:hypothetical protein C8F04DRAFT_1121137 [Mycena alexandri]